VSSRCRRYKTRPTTTCATRSSWRSAVAGWSAYSPSCVRPIAGPLSRPETESRPRSDHVRLAPAPISPWPPASPAWSSFSSSSVFTSASFSPEPTAVRTDISRRRAARIVIGFLFSPLYRVVRSLFACCRYLPTPMSWRFSWSENKQKQKKCPCKIHHDRC